MNNNEYSNIISELSDGVVNHYWNGSSPPVEVDHSARILASKRLFFIISEHINNISNDAQSKIMSLLVEDEFKTKTEEIIELAISDFKRHYIKFGGKSALFVVCLLLSLGSDRDSRIYKAKSSLINWYAEDRRISASCVDGYSVKAWFPFEWFSTNFDAIAASVVASVVTGSLSQIWYAFFQSYTPIKSSCNPFLEDVLIAKTTDQTMDEFKSSLDDSGFIEKFFYLFNLSDDEQKELIDDWWKSFLLFQKTLDANETNLLSELLKGPVLWKDNIQGSSRLRDIKLIRLIEISQNNLWLSLYPKIFEDEN